MWGPIGGIKCIQILENADPNTCHNNYYCAPVNSSLTIEWSSHRPCGANNVYIIETVDPHTWPSMP